MLGAILKMVYLGKSAFMFVMLPGKHTTQRRKITNLFIQTGFSSVQEHGHDYNASMLKV